MLRVQTFLWHGCQWGLLCAPAPCPAHALFVLARPSGMLKCIQCIAVDLLLVLRIVSLLSGASFPASSPPSTCPLPQKATGLRWGGHLPAHSELSPLSHRALPERPGRNQRCCSLVPLTFILLCHNYNVPVSIFPTDIDPLRLGPRLYHCLPEHSTLATLE